MIVLQSKPKQIPVQQYKVNYDSWPIDWLSNYIEKLQRKTIVEKSKDILQNINHAKNTCCGKDNYLLESEALFRASVDRLSAHMKKEEQYLFPFVREMMQAKELNYGINRAALNKVQSLIELLNDEHAAETAHLKWSAGLRDSCITISNFNKPVTALLKGFAEFEQACQLHISLQYKFLFPKIIAAKYTVA